jgi:hypothetical protein
MRLLAVRNVTIRRPAFIQRVASRIGCQFRVVLPSLMRTTIR